MDFLVKIQSYQFRVFLEYSGKRETRKGKIRFFVEDDAEKAAKLAYVCDVVLLLDQPYNTSPSAPLPGNVIRVRSWDEIYQKIRTLS